MSNDSQIRSEAQQLAEVMNTRLKALYAMLNGTAANLNALTTTEKSNLVNAINELKSDIDAIEVGSVTWDTLTGKPSTFPPATHNHTGVYDPAGSAATAQATAISTSATAISDAITALIGGAPGALDTLNELAAALGDDESFAASVTAALAAKAPATVVTDYLDTSALTPASAVTWDGDVTLQPTLAQDQSTTLTIDNPGRTGSLSAVIDGPGPYTLTLAAGAGYTIQIMGGSDVADAATLGDGDGYELSYKLAGTVIRCWFTTYTL